VGRESNRETATAPRVSCGGLFKLLCCPFLGAFGGDGVGKPDVVFLLGLGAHGKLICVCAEWYTDRRSIRRDMCIRSTSRAWIISGTCSPGIVSGGSRRRGCSDVVELTKTGADWGGRLLLQGCSAGAVSAAGTRFSATQLISHFGCLGTTFLISTSCSKPFTFMKWELLIGSLQ
jgi:hypothetical protein